MKKVRNISEPTNGGRPAIETGIPYIVDARVVGVADLLLHRWNTEAVGIKAAAPKNSKAKRSDDLDSYVYRNDHDEICIPGEYVRQSIINAARFQADPRSPRKSALDLFKAGVTSLTELAGLGTSEWDYEDRRRVQVQRSAITRVRPAMRSGWQADISLMIILPEYIGIEWLHEVATTAGRIIGVGDFRPTYGRYSFERFEVRAAA